MHDQVLNSVIQAIPRQPQKQYSTDEQLRALQYAAIRLGLYDASDAIEDRLLRKETKKK